MSDQLQVDQVKAVVRIAEALEQMASLFDRYTRPAPVQPRELPQPLPWVPAPLAPHPYVGPPTSTPARIVCETTDGNPR